MSSVAYLNGEYLALAEARVPVTDRGFLFGDGIYEVIPIYEGCPFELERHLQRLQRSLAEIGLGRQPLLMELDLERVIEQLIRENGLSRASCYIQITRGPSMPRDHRFPADAVPTVFAMLQPLAQVAPGVLEHGVQAVTQPDLRWARSVIKSTSLLANVLAKQSAHEAGAEEAILIRDGEVIEGAAMSVFIAGPGEIATPPVRPEMLQGVTQQLVLELARERLAAAWGLSVSERPIGENELSQVDEIWLTSSTREVIPVTRLDGRPVGSGRPGPIWSAMWDLMQERKAICAQTPVIPRAHRPMG